MTMKKKNWASGDEKKKEKKIIIHDDRWKGTISNGIITIIKQQQQSNIG